MSLTAGLQQTVDDFQAMEEQDRLQLLLEFADELPELPPRYAEHPDLLERVVECQSPVFLFVEVDDHVHVHATAPPESPTTRGMSASTASSRRCGCGACPACSAASSGRSASTAPLAEHQANAVMPRSSSHARISRS